MRQVVLAIAFAVLSSILPTSCTTTNPSPEVVLKEPPPLPKFVEECRAFVPKITGESETSNRSNYYCGCVAELALHLSDGWAKELNVSEQETLSSMCLADSYVVYPAVNIESK